MQIIRLNETTAALIEVPFTSVLASDLQSRISGATLPNTSITVYSKRGGTGPAVHLVAGAWTATDDANAPGVRGYKPAAAELVAGIQTLIFTGTNMEPREVPIMVVYEDPYRPAYYGKVAAGTLATDQFTTDLVFANANQVKDGLVEFLTGACAGAVKPIAGYATSGGKITLKTGYVLPAAPSANDVIRIITN